MLVFFLSMLMGMIIGHVLALILIEIFPEM